MRARCMSRVSFLVVFLVATAGIGSAQDNWLGGTGNWSNSAGRAGARAPRLRLSHTASPLPTASSNWIGGIGNWSNASDWIPNGVPSGADVTIDSGGNDVVTLDMNAGIASLILGGTSGSAMLQNLAGSAETLAVTGATTIAIPGTLTFGNGSTLTFGGGLTVGGSFDLIGASATVTGTMTLSSGSSTNIAGGSPLTVNGTLTNLSGSFYTGQTYGGGNTLTVNGGFTNSGTLYMYGLTQGGGADTLNVSGTLTNSAGATLYLNDNSGDVANIGTLSNSGNVHVGTGTTLNLTNQPKGITDVTLNSSLTLNGTLTAGTGNGLAKLASVEGTLILANGQITADTPSGGNVTLASGGSLALNRPGTSLSVTGGLNDSGSLNVVNGASLTLTQSMTLNPGSSLNLAGNSTLTVSGNLTNNSASFYTGYAPAYVNGGGDKLTVTGGFTNSGALSMYGGSYGGAGDTLSVTGTLTNNPGDSLPL